jgi:hypothetical protein
MPVNISINTNTIAVQENINYISVNDPNNPNIVDITQPITEVVEIITAGPQGPPGLPGPSGSAGPTVNTGSFVTTSSFNAFTSSYNTGSFTGSFTGSLFGTASFAISSSRAVSSSFATSASFATQALSASYVPTLQQVTNAGRTINVLSGSNGITIEIGDSSANNWYGLYTLANGTANGVYALSDNGNGVYATGGSRGVIASSADIGVETSGANIGLSATGQLGAQISGDTGIYTYGTTLGLDSYSLAGTSIRAISDGSATAVIVANNYDDDGAGGIGIDISSLKNTGLSAFSRDEKAAIFNISTANTSNIVEFKKNSVNQAYITHDGTIVSNKSLINTTVDNGVDELQVAGTSNLNGNTVITGSLTVTNGITGSLFGTSSWANRSISSSFATNSTSASYAINAATASNILGGVATHIPYFITDTTLATSSLYQSGSSTVIINQDNATTANPEALYVWQPSPTSFNVISGKGNINNYLQLNIQNTNQGISASSDVVATADNGNESTNYIDMGINSENYNVNFIGGVNDAYLYSTGRHLHVGNASNFPVQIFAGGSDVDIHNKLELNPNNQHSMSGSLDVSGSVKAFSFTGSLFGTASYASNGGVTQLLAGPNVILSPTNGLGQVTISSTSGGGGGFNTATGSYGSFYDTTTQTNPVGNIPRSMSLNTTAITNGVSVSGSTNPFNTYIKTETAGVYNIQFSAQIDKTDSGEDNIDIWLRKNGIDLIDTATSLTLPKNNNKLVAAWNWFVSSATNDYYQIIWSSADTSMRLFAQPQDGHPGIPSVIVTANRIDQFMSNTGSFSGTFTGDLTGTASFATTSSYTQNAQSASYASTASYSLNSITSSYAITAGTAINAQSASNFIVTNTIQLDQSLIDYASVNSSIVGNNNLYQISTGSYTSAFTKYTVSNGANARAGEFVTVWNGTTVVNYDNSTTDIGNTSDVTFASSIVTSQIKIDAVTATSAWLIKSTTTFI